VARHTVLDRDRVVAALDEEWDSLTALGATLDPEDWERPTACPGWSVKDNYAHIIGGESMVLGRPAPQVEVPPDLPHVRNAMGQLNQAWVEASRSKSAQQMLAELDEVITQRRAAVAQQDQADFDAPSWTPAGDDTYGRLMAIRVMDQWFHEQDIREATGRSGHLEGLAPDVVLDEVGAALGYVVGKQAGFPSSTSLRIELTAPMARVYDIVVTDRARIVDGLADEPTVRLTMPGATFCRLAGGRRPWDDPEIRPLIGIEGDTNLGEQLLSNVAYLP
jgi:uncharacterized protein (TIGR03083 family)